MNFLDSGFNVLKDSAAPAVGPTLSSVHVPVPMGSTKKKKLKYIDKAGEGIMIVWFPPEDLAVRLAPDDGEDADQLHVTLAYFGKSLTDEELTIIRQVLKTASEKYSSLPGELGGLARFPATDSSDGKDVLVLLADVPYLESVRENILNTLTDLGIDAYRNHGYTPHMTLAYVDPGESLDISDEAAQRIPISVDALTFCINGDRERFPLSGEDVFSKKMEDAPNYKEATNPERSCSDCVHGGDGYCDLFHFNYKSGWSCDAFMPLNKQFEKYTPPQPVQANAKLGVDAYKQTVNDETRANEEIMLLASDLANGVPVGFEKVKFISDYLTAHYNVEDSANWAAHGIEWQEWNGLGARAGLSWAKRCLRKQLEKASLLTDDDYDDLFQDYPADHKRDDLEKGGPGSGRHPGPASKKLGLVLKSSTSVTKAGAQVARFELKNKAGRSVGEIESRVVGKALEVKYSYLDPDLRGKGVGKELYQQAVTYASSKGLLSLTSDENGTSKDAEKVWERLGATKNAVANDFGVKQYLLPIQKRDDEMSKHEANVSLTASISKVDDDQHLVFGWASVATEKGIPVVDRQGDTITDSEMEKAAYDFVLNARVAGEMHKKEVRVGKLVESIVFTKEKQKALGIDLGKTAWWVGFSVHDNNVWKAIKSGQYTAFSIHGRGLREEVTLES